MKTRKLLAILLTLAMIVAISATSAFAAVGDMNNPVTPTTGVTLAFGDTSAPTWPESNMYFKETGTMTYDAVYSTNGSTVNTSYYPSLLTFIATGASTITATDVNFVTYDPVTQEPSYSTTTNINSSNAYTIMPLSNNAQIVVNSSIYVNLSAPKSTATSGGAAPGAVVSYLPIGQFATGAGWGSATGKFTGGYASTGVSLGALGGYIEFDFDDPDTTAVEGITNDPRNPYGVDLVVYGNAFSGNPEAGAVMVSETGSIWYELAGSRYYDGGFTFNTTNASNTSKYSNVYTGALRNTTVVYELKSNGIDVTLGSYGPYPFTSATSWWPTTVEYPEFANSSSGNAHVGNLVINHGGNAVGSTLTFGGVTAIADSNTTADYAFGYADVTPNGSPSTYGDAVNPYTPYTNNKTGGDGFDLEWAVNIANGMPADLYNRDGDGEIIGPKTFRYVRVYSAVLDNATFGETSTEVCGIFATANASTVSVGRTNKEELELSGFGIVYNDNDIADYDPSVSYKGDTVIYEIDGGLSVNDEIVITGVSGCNVYANNVFLNSNNSYTYTVTSGVQCVRIIVQQGTAAPYIVLIK